MAVTTLRRTSRTESEYSMNKASGYDIHCHVVINMSTIQNIHVFSKLEKSLSQLRVITSSKKAVSYVEVAACEVFQDTRHRWLVATIYCHH